MSSKSKKSRTRTKSHNASRMPNVYPAMPGYTMPAPQWLPPQPYQWYQPLPNLSPMPNANIPWMPHSPGQNSSTISSKAGLATGAPDEFTVDALRRIYNNDDGSIEIERVKVQRRQGIYDTKQGSLDFPSESQSLVPASHFLNERRPPPRKHKRKGTDVARKPDDAGPSQGWYPYMPYMPQPFPYAYPYGYVWPMPPHSPLNMHPQFHSPTDDSDSSASHHEPFSVSMDSPDLLQAKSMSPESHRPLSSATGSHVAESLGTDIAPSDSVSMRGFKRETSIERILRKSLADSKTSEKSVSETLTNKDIEKTKEWMEDMQKAFESKSGFSSEVTGDRSSFTTAPSDIPTPPLKAKFLKDSTSKIILMHRKSNSESNIDDREDQRNTVSLPLLENTRVSESDLIFALNNTDSNRSDRFREPTEHKNELTEDNIAKLKSMSDHGGRDSRTSTTSFHSTRQSADENLVDTDSTDIAIPLDSSTADESVENFDDETAIDHLQDKNYKWILQTVEDFSSEGEQNDDKNTTEIIESWRTEVSLWRARLVVSLCRGQGLDQQDWGTFHLLVQHPLSLDMKLSLLHAQRLCSQNYDVGIALLRNSLLHLATFGETLMKPENERTTGWKTITIDSNQPWVLIKGSLEILRVFGFRIRGNGTLRFKQKYSPEISVIARLTLDMLVLAEEFRLFLNGAHQCPINITQLFTAARDFQYEKALRSKSAEQDNITDSSKSDLNLKADSSIRSFEIGHLDTNTQTSTDSIKNVTPLPSVSVIERIPSDNLNDQNEGSTQHSSEVSTPTKESLTDLLPPSTSLSAKHENSDRESGSRETLIPTPTPQTEEVSVSEASKEGTAVEKGKIRRSINGRDNPEDHVYEEIGDIKEQVEELKRSESASQSPPPLPPKTKNSQNDDLYPQVDWSISSQYSSLHGSASKRKKRRAPMPPEFLNPDFKSSENENIKQNETAPGNEKSELSKNPFYEERIKPAGYVGKNPFYEDLKTKSDTSKVGETKCAEHEKISSKVADTVQEIDYEKENQTIRTTASEISVDDISEISSCSTLPAGVRPQRKKRKKHIQKLRNDSEKVSHVSPESNSNKEIVSVPSDIRDQSYAQTFKETSKDLPKHITNAKNDEREHQCRSQVVVPSESIITEGVKKIQPKESEKKDVILQKISITYDISLDDNTLSVNKVIDSKEEPAVEVLKIRDKHKKEIDLTPSKAKHVSNADDNLSQKRKESEMSKLTTDEDKTAESNIDLSKQYSKVQKGKVDTRDIPPLLPPKSALRLIDDIPYIDSNDVKNYKKSYVTFERQQPPYYGLSEINPKEVINLSVAKSEEKMSTFLKRSSFVPFIDDSDLPPDLDPPSPPPSPPLPPPSPPLLSVSSFPLSSSSQLMTMESSIEDSSKSLPLESLNKPCQISTNTNELPENLQDQVLSPVASPIVPDTLSRSDSKLSSENFQQESDTPLLSKTAKFSPVQDPTEPPSPPHSPPPSPPKTLLTSSMLSATVSEDLPLSENILISDTKDSNKYINPTEDLNSKDKSEINENLNEHLLEESAKYVINEKEENESESSSSTLVQENDDSARKSLLLFGIENNNTEEHISKQELGSPHYEIPEARKLTEEAEERYEIPDVTKSTQIVPTKSISDNFKVNKISKRVSTEKTENDEEILPKRPPRHQLSFKIPPPRPPKPEIYSGPPLPPKTGSLKSSKSSSVTSSHSSLPSTLVKPNKNNLRSGKEVQPSPLAIPEMYRSSPESIAKPTHETYKASSLSSIPTAQTKNIRTDTSLSSKKNLPKSSKPPSECVSLPSSPKAVKPLFRKDIKETKKQKSWPFLLCDCVHPTGSNDDIKYVIKIK